MNEALLEEFFTILPLIEQRLNEFSSLPKSLWRREVFLCLLTPQSKPTHAEGALSALEEKGLFEGKLSLDEIATELRTGTRYVRFHHTKAKRIQSLLRRQEELEELLHSGLSPTVERTKLVTLVEGFGMKEASHALRNIGRRGLAILDRHILRALHHHKVISAIPSSLPEKKYLEIEEYFRLWGSTMGLSLDALDLFFWYKAVGFIYK